MKTLKLFILLLFISVLCKGQNNTWIGVNLDYMPAEIVDIQDFRTELSVKYGAEYLKVCGHVKLNDTFDEFFFGLGGELTCLKIGANIDVLFNGGFSFLVDQVPADRFRTRYHPYNIYYGLRFENKLSESISVAAYLQNQNYGQKIVKVFGVGGSFKL